GTRSSRPTRTHAAQSPPRQTPAQRSATASVPQSIQTQIQTCRSPNCIISAYTSITLTHTLARQNNVLPDGPTTRGAGVHTPFYLVLPDKWRWPSPWSGSSLPTNGRPTTDRPRKTGTHATKWPRHA